MGEKAGTQQAKKLADGLSEAWWTLVGAAILCLLVYLPGKFVWEALPAALKYPLVYSVHYSVSIGQVQVAKQPSDCEWSHAPLGDKSCHYEKRVGARKNASGQIQSIFVGWVKVQE